MNLYDEIVKTYPFLTDLDFKPTTGLIQLSDDGDGVQYISKWEYSEPLPDSMKVGK
jgi:hypothetical protein